MLFIALPVLLVIILFLSISFILTGAVLGSHECMSSTKTGPTAPISSFTFNLKFTCSSSPLHNAVSTELVILKSGDWTAYPAILWDLLATALKFFTDMVDMSTGLKVFLAFTVTIVIIVWAHNEKK